MINPVDFMVFPNQGKIVENASERGSVISAMSNETLKIDRKVLRFNTAGLRTISNRPATMASIISIVIRWFFYLDSPSAALCFGDYDQYKLAPLNSKSPHEVSIFLHYEDRI